jgi:hypothetical protein
MVTGIFFSLINSTTYSIIMFYVKSLILTLARMIGCHNHL